MSNVIKMPDFLFEKKHLSLIKEEPAVQQFDIDDEYALAASPLLKKAHDEAQEIITKARLEYDQIQKNIQEQEEAFKEKCKAVYRKHCERGYDDGFNHGKKEGKALYKEKIDKANRIISCAEAAYGDYLSRAEPDILSLAVRIAETIINTALEEKPECWMSLVKKAVAGVKEQDAIQITVPPKWFELVISHQKELLSLVRGARLQIFADEQLEEHMCYIETPFGKLDASVDSQLTVMKQTLLEMMEASSHEGCSVD
ncbi:flagellar assembly protein FliH [Scopulibacillus cellulosilyticus]|uniref:Flagellar assembly protein FliH n=1 Tax=Scopulibacillus cellulosilyticus TaxID=2665665 RepID=A0ABW2PTU9_9BACL